MQRFRLDGPQSLSRRSWDWNIFPLPAIKPRIIQAILTTLFLLFCSYRTVSTFCISFLLQITAIYIYMWVCWCYNTLLGRLFLTFQRIVEPSSSGQALQNLPQPLDLKIKTPWSFKMPRTTYKVTKCNNPDDPNIHPQYVNLRSCKSYI